MEIKKEATAVICLSPNAGGMELASLKLAKILSDYIEITLIVQKDKFMHKQCIENPDYQMLHYEAIKFSTTLSPSIIFHTRKIVQKKDIKNVIFVGASEIKSLYFAFLGLDINFIVRHGTTKSNPKKDFLHTLVYSQIAYHIAISKHLSKNVKYIVPFGKNTQLKTIVPTMPKAISSLKKVNNSTLELIHVGRITQGKGLKEALLACDVLHQNGIKFELESFGGMASGYKNEFENFISSLEYRDSFKLCGFTNNIYDEYPKHDIFIFPTKGEGFGNVMMEAISHGIIILSFDNSAISNFLEMGFHMHLVEDGSVNALKNRLLYIANNLENEKKLALDNIEIAKKVFAPKREVMEYIELLK